MIQTCAGATALILALAGQRAGAGLNEWTSNGPDGGAIQAIVIDPITPSTLYAGVAAGSIFKSTDGGNSWSFSGDGVSTTLTSMAVDPATPANVYAGGYERVYRSTDGGASWTSSTFPAVIFSLAIAPSAPASVYAGSTNGVYKTGNGGVSWGLLASGMSLAYLDNRDVAVDPTNASIVLGAGDDLYRSTNAGGTWGSVSPTAPPFVSYEAVTFDPTDANVAYAATTNGAGAFKSTTNGASWTPMTLSHAWDIAVDPGSSNIIYAGYGGGVAHSTTGGSAWTGYLNTGLAHTTVKDLAVHATSGDVFAATGAAGVYKSTDGGNNWAASNVGLAGVDVRDLARDPLNPNVLYAVGGGAYKSTDNGNTWSEIDNGLISIEVSGRFYRNFTDVAIDPVNTSTVYAATSQDIFKTVDGGANWSLAGTNPPGFNGGIAVDATQPSTLYATTSTAVYKSTNGGTTWSPTNLPSGTVTIAADPVSSGVVYMADCGGSVHKTVDGGATYTVNPTGGAGCSSIQIDATNPTTLYALGGMFLRKSTDGGTNWVDAANGLGLSSSVTVTGLAIDPSGSLRLFAATKTAQGGTWGGSNLAQTYFSSDGGANWSAYGGAVSGGYDLTALSVDPNDGNVVHAASGGRSVVQIERACGDGVADPAEACDDGNEIAGDGCSPGCLVETGWTCSAPPASTCAEICGDGLVVGNEPCDDGGGNGNACCSLSCTVVDDADGDLKCDRDDLCPNVAPQALSPAPMSVRRTLLIYKGNGPGGGDDAPKIIRAQFSTPQSFNPATTHAVRVRLRNATTNATLFEVNLQAGGFWSQANPARKRWRYRDATSPTTQGVRVATIKESPTGSGNYQFRMVGKDADILGPLGVNENVEILLQIEAANAGLCLSHVTQFCQQTPAKDLCHY